MPSLKAKGTETAERVASLLGSRVYVPITVPRTDVVGHMRLIGRDEVFGIKVAIREKFKAAGLVDDRGRVLEIAVDDWNNEIAVRHVALAMRAEPHDEAAPLAPLDQWRAECDDEQIASLWGDYCDLRDRLDPLGDESILRGVLDAGDIETMRAAVKKKEPSVLMSYGSRKLASFILSSAELPAV